MTTLILVDEALCFNGFSCIWDFGADGGRAGQVWRHSVMGGNCIPNGSIRGSLFLCDIINSY